MTQEFGKILIILGLVLLITGLFLLFGEGLLQKLPFKIGRLPGDIYIKKDNFTFYFPVITSIIISIVLTLVFYLLRKK